MDCSVLNCIVEDYDSSAILIKARIVYFTCSEIQIELVKYAEIRMATYGKDLY